jgi:hypothetical protein
MSPGPVMKHFSARSSCFVRASASLVIDVWRNSRFFVTASVGDLQRPRVPTKVGGVLTGDRTECR